MRRTCESCGESGEDCHNEKYGLFCYLEAERHMELAGDSLTYDKLFLNYVLVYTTSYYWDEFNSGVPNVDDTRSSRRKLPSCLLNGLFLQVMDLFTGETR
jgi:hypothetical protein